MNLDLYIIVMTAMLHFLLLVFLITQTSPTLLPFIVILCAVLEGNSRDYYPQRIMDSGWRTISDPGIILKLVLVLYFLRHSMYWTEVLINTSSNWEIWWCLLLIISSFIINGGFIICYVLDSIGVVVISFEESFD